MFLDPSHRNELVSISGNVGAKGKISADSEQNSTCPSVSRKDRCHLSFKLSILYTVSPSTTKSLSELISCLHRVKPLGRLDS
ncbi:hypothetical protein ACRRTK_012629 [Alexandromys fortis]